MPFYKIDTLEKVDTLTVTLTDDNRSEAHYPLLGWKWFPNDKMAKEQLAFKFDPKSWNLRR